MDYADMIYAVEQARRMRGGAQSHLMRCSDGNYYVVKFPNNPQGPEILANELLGARLARRLGLPVAHGTVVQVDEILIQLTEALCVEMPRRRLPCQAGPCFGSLYQGNPRYPTNENDLSDADLRYVTILNEFCGMLVFDLWTCNTDGRQVVFCREAETWRYRAVMIDQGFCFNAYEWNFPDSPLRGLYRRLVVYENVRSIDAFEPWLTRLESEIDVDAIWRMAQGIPSAWYYSEPTSLARLIERLDRRRSRVRELLFHTRDLARQPFPNWIPAVESKIA